MTAGIYALAGPSIVIENLADQLGKSGVAVTIGALKFKRVPSNGVYNVRTLPVYNALKLKRFLDDFDVVHSHHAITNYLALISRTPFVYHYHGAPSFGRGNLFRFSMLLSVKLMNHAFDAVIAVSESGAIELKRYFGLKNVHVIYNGVNTNHFKNGFEERFRQGTPQFLFVGNLYEHKNVEELIFALKELVKAYPKAHLQVVGGGCTYARLESLVVKLNLQDHVTLVGRVPDSDLPYYYASCDVYITASRYEVCPVPLLEAMACGKPVVVTSVGDVPVLVKNGVNGIVIPPGNADILAESIVYLAENPELRNLVGEANVRKMKEYDWNKIAKQYHTLYLKIINT